MKKSERNVRINELSDIVNILIGRIARLEQEVARLGGELNKRS